ncbi:MAG: hypothetical protein ACI9KM_000355, partial [Rubritalea sp.]
CNNPVVTRKVRKLPAQMQYCCHFSLPSANNPLC